MKKRILVVIGTRPEAIKMAPLIGLLKKEEGVELYVCNSGQHTEMLDQVLDFFNIVADYNLNVMTKIIGLGSLYATILSDIEVVFKNLQPDLVLVHGDTATTSATAMAAFLNKVPVSHVEAGLRTDNILSPWPEEFNRRIVGMVAEHHFAPTLQAKANLLAENIPENRIIVTGNTVIDALFQTLNILNEDRKFQWEFILKFPFMLNTKRTVLVTAHRRENLGDGIEQICHALKTIVQNNSDVQIVFPVHLNPSVQSTVRALLGDLPNVFLIPPMDYNDFIYMMTKSYLIITDSGGIQEEAPSLGIPVLVTRDVTERPEAVMAGTVRLVGTDKNQIIYWVEQLLNSDELYRETTRASNPYGDGQACERIVAHILGRAPQLEDNQSEGSYLMAPSGVVIK